MNLIAAVDKNWAIGKNNELLVSIPNDMKMFRQMTTGKVVVMGRKTLESFPNGLPLKNRVNIVLTKNQNYQVKGAIIVHSVEEVLEELKKYDSEDVYVIGGEQIYRQMLGFDRNSGVGNALQRNALVDGHDAAGIVGNSIQDLGQHTGFVLQQ